MAAGFVRNFQSFTKCSTLVRVRYINDFANSRSTSKRNKMPDAAFLFGFGLAGLVGFSGLYEKKKLKPRRAKTVSAESDGDEQKEAQSIPKKEKASRSHHSPWTLQSAIDESRSIIQCMKEQTGSPGVSVAVSVNGQIVWSEGFGFADVENRVLCSAKTVMRIASISKPLTATAAAKLWEEGKLDLDAPIQTYVTSFPEKTFNGATTTLTTRHLLSHLGGIRHYEKTPPDNVNEENKNNKNSTCRDQVVSLTDTELTDTLTDSGNKQSAFSHEEYFIKDHFNTVTEALSLFKDDPLLSVPGTSYFYTTHGWTLVSAVIERAANQNFLEVIKKLFKDLGMENTCAEFNDQIIHNRARFYQRNKKGHLVNAPYVDNSHKWGGGGFMSTVEDLVQFGNSMLYAKQMGDTKNTTGCRPGFLRPETVTELWKIAANTEGKSHKDGGYGLGWVVIPEKQDFGACRHQLETVLHSGAAVGASSVLLIRPTEGVQPPKGVIVSILVNLQEVKLEKTAMAVAACFEKTQL